jgi:outer membrane protein
MNYSLLKRYLVIAFACYIHGICFAQNDSIANLKSITLDEALGLGIENNRQLKMANTDVAIANENVSQAKIAKMPRIGFNTGYNYIGDPKLYEGFYKNSLNVDYYNHQAYGNVISAVPVYTGNLINKKIEQQQLISEIQKSVVKMTEADIRLAIIKQYYTLEKLYRQIEITNQNIKNTDLRINQLKSRVANGQNLKSDLLRTELQQSRFKVSVITDTNDIALVSNYLDILIGLPTNLILKPEADDITTPLSEVDLKKSIEEANLNRIEIMQSEIEVKISEATLDMTRSGFKPAVNANLMLNTEYPAQWPNYVNIVNYWAVGLSLNWDISSFYNLKHRTNADKYQIDKRNIALDETRDQIEREVKSAFIKFEESRVNISTFKKDVELAQSNYKIVKSRYDNDFALISDMVDAELQLNEARISLVNANLDLIIQYYSLQYAKGTL